HEAGFSTTRFKNAHGTFTIELIDDCNDWTLQEKWDLKLNDQAGKPEPSNLLYRGSEVKSAGKFVFAYSRNHLGELTDYIGDVVDVGGDFMARFQTPRISERLLSPDVVFPITHLHQILSEARRGRTGFEATVFDGANAITYRAVTSIGRPLRSDDTNPRVVAARTELDRKNSDRLPDGRQWPIRIDYFPLGDNYAPPVFSREILLHENGIILSFHFDYVDIRLEARLKTLDIREPKACPQ
ncbi:MAG: EipB family protein, partial [Geminicoccaceae bacterium]